MTKELIIILIILTISFLLFRSVGFLYKKVFESHKQIHLKFLKLGTGTDCSDWIV